ncbi:hypothetical protein [Roseivirga pacifica]
MSKKYRFDRNSFSAYKAEEQKSDYQSWKGTSLEYRLKAANYLNSMAFDFDLDAPPRLDKTIFYASKQE